MKSSVIILAVTTAAMAALAGCASDRKTAMQDDPASAPGYSAWASASGPEPANSTAANAPGTASGAKSSPGPGTATAHNWTGVVLAVDPILRQDAAAMGVGMAGAAAAGGALALEGSPNDRVYRITMRADDGTTQVVVLDSIPSYKAGDRVRYRDGAVLRE